MSAPTTALDRVQRYLDELDACGHTCPEDHAHLVSMTDLREVVRLASEGIR